MSLRKKEAKPQKVKPPLGNDCTSEFKKDWTGLERSGRYDMARLKAVMMDLIASEGPLDPARRDHPLQGKWADYRECHIGEISS